MSDTPDTNDDSPRLRIRRTSLGECVRMTVDLAPTCDPASFEGLPIKGSSATPEHVQRARELARRLRLVVE